MDELDVKILNRLLRDSKVPRKILANEVGMSESALSKRIQQLHEIDKTIERFSIDIDYEKIGYQSNAITLIKMAESNSSDIHKVIDQIKNDDNAIEVYMTFGEWDIFVRWVCRRSSQIIDSITNITNTNRVKNTLTVDLSKKYKKQNGPDL